MKTRSVLVAAMLMGAVGCASSNATEGPKDAAVGPDAGPNTDAMTGDGFGAECTGHADCESGICVQLDGENEPGFCSEECPDGICPDGYACRDVLISDFSDARVCVPAEETFCNQCTANADCGDTSDFCIELTGGNFCTKDCTGNPSSCPAGFTCQQVAGTGDTIVGMQCMPTNGICCVDGDGDLRGDGMGCATTDCDDDNPAVYDDAVEICDGFDQDCVGGIDVDPTDCAEAKCQLGALGYFERNAEPCESGACTEQNATLCGLYTCADGGENGDSCATACDVEDDSKCVPDAHCDASVCLDDLADGLASNEDSDCESDHSQNGFCCPFGDCCQMASDCPTFGTIAPVCDNPTTCQGTRGEAVCTNSYSCASNGTEQDDSACTGATLANECGYYPDRYCDGTVDQTSPTCATSCNNDGECDANAYCNGDNECVADEPDGGVCNDGDGNGNDECESAHCQNGFCCSGGDCCQNESDCPSSYSTAPVCNSPSSCQGDADVAECVNSVCGTQQNVDDDSACGVGTLSDNCGHYLPVYCDGNSVQSDPACPPSCQSDADCDAGAYCNQAKECVADEPDGGGCYEADGQGAAECQSGHCQNGFCCDSGDCCSGDSDCDAYDIAADCDSATTCQGTRTDGVCTGAKQCTAQQVGDDSACGGLESDSCGPYPSVFCSGAQSQTAPTCSSMCMTDDDCDPSAHCDGMACVPDTGKGGFCDEQSDCGSGLTCVDNVCCDGACNGGCEACDLAGSEGDCVPVPNGQDPDNECGLVDCGSYYHGWSGDSCYDKADVPAATASCNGSGSCRSAATECAASGQGSVVETCDSFCQDPNAGTCTGTTAGTCANVDQGSETCGYGPCQVTEPRCVNGAPNACTPNSGASSTETCNNIDDNCDGTVDNGSFSDAAEGASNSCGSVTLAEVGTTSTDDTVTYNSLTIYGSGDDDYYAIPARETDDSCNLCDGLFDEDYALWIGLTVPSGAGSYQFCTGSSCGTVDNACQEVLAGETLWWKWQLDGECPGNDSYTRYVHIYGDNAPGYECLPYTLQYIFDDSCQPDV